MDEFEGYEDEFGDDFRDDFRDDFMDDDDFDGFEPENRLEIGYSQLEQIGGGDVGLGTTIGGGSGRIDKIMQQQMIPKELLYINRLKAELNNLMSFEKTANYAILAEKIPRYWLKNPDTLAASFLMYDQLLYTGNDLTSSKLQDFSGETGVREEDLYRYYKLVKANI